MYHVYIMVLHRSSYFIPSYFHNQHNDMGDVAICAQSMSFNFLISTSKQVVGNNEA
jgi:hypothetical protein